MPLYEPQAFQIVIRVTAEDGSIAYEDRTTTAEMVRSFNELVSWLVKENPVPPGTLLLKGPGLVPGDDFTLLPGQWVEIHVPEVGTLANPVAHASELSSRRFT